MKKIGLADVKLALRDSRFRETLPESMKDDVNKFLINPGCPSCSVPLFRRILREAVPQIEAYFPNREIEVVEEKLEKLNHWQVINCNITELETRMRKLPPGRKQISMARYQDQVTVIINEME